MRFKKLGNTQLQVSVIGQGCMGIGGYFQADDSRDDEVIKALRLGLDLGMNFIDTAEIYGAGHSEEIVGKAMANCRKNVILATKVSPEHLSFENLLQSAEHSLRRLQTDYIDVYQIHWSNRRIPVTETFDAIRRLIAEGKVRYAGVSNFSIEELKQAYEILGPDRLVSLQDEFNIFSRGAENALLPYCEQKQLTFISYSPLNQGHMEANTAKLNFLREMAQRCNGTQAQILLAWLISKDPVVAIPKSVNSRHIRENAAAAQVKLSIQDLQDLDRVFESRISFLRPQEIAVIADSHGQRNVYLTLQEAIENRFCFIPGPQELAEEIKKGNTLKPIKVRKSLVQNDRPYELVEGRMRYWGWLIAFDGKKPIPSYIYEYPDRS